MLINKSSIPLNRLEKIIKFCKPRGIELCDLIVKDTKNPWSAEFYYGAWQEPNIIARFGPHEQFPFYSKPRKSCKGYQFGNYQFENKTECVIYVLSHEFWHLKTFLDPETKWMMYSTGPEKEEIADSYALKILNKYRKLKSEGIDPLK